MIPVIEPWVNLAVFKHEHDARALEERLQQQGFEARTRNDRKIQLFWFLAPPRATFRVQVGAKDVHTAQEFIETERSVEILTQRAIHCPSCKSVQIEYPQMTRRFLTPTLLMDLGILFHIIEHEAYCADCHYMWPLSGPQATDKAKKVAI
jgi:hypothetical protein